MSDFLIANESNVRLVFFVVIFSVVIAWELAAPRRVLTQSRFVRWYSNIGIVILNTVLVRILIPLVPVALAVIAEKRGWGAFNLVEIPQWLAILISVVVLDLIIYFQHVIFHAVPALWRLHRMHHSDLDFDVTTGARFHPGEIIISIFVKLGAIIAIGPPAVAVIIFEILLNGTSMFNHGNIRLSIKIDRILRWFVVTPDMHRVHHSNIRVETNSNFGFSLPYWDRLFGTYRDCPHLGHEVMTIGLDTFRDAEDLHLHKILLQPLKPGANNYTFRKRIKK